ncbi:MAG: hypothetical protein IPF84_17490, partial [Proteobacteria bacterium]|nr:hypothetical protein [Pseudomonadota bacterium]
MRKIARELAAAGEASKRGPTHDGGLCGVAGDPRESIQRRRFAGFGGVKAGGGSLVARGVAAEPVVHRLRSPL